MFPVSAALKAANPEYEWLYTYVRVPTPTYTFTVGTGAPAPARRTVVDTSQCLKCHVGSLYQHGNTRVDNANMCVICHNPASSEQNVRTSMGILANGVVDTTKTYDGLVGQTYELKTMLHRIHSAGESTATQFVIYRTRGIYGWAPVESLLGPNWASLPCVPPSTTGAHLVYGATNTAQNLPAVQLLRADVLRRAGAERLQGLPRHDPGHQGLLPGSDQGRRDDAQRGQHDVEDADRRHAARRIGGFVRDVPPHGHRREGPRVSEWFQPGGVPERAPDHSRRE